NLLKTGKQAYARLVAGGVCARAVSFAVLAALFPLLALIYVSAEPNGPRTLAVVAIGVTLLSILALIRTLRPIALLARMLEQHARRQTAAERGRIIDDHRRLIANFNAIAAQLETLS